MPTKGKIHSFETFGAADGPGVRFIVFLSGCGFRCAYCHNPDTWARPAQVEMSPDEVLSKALRYKTYWRGGGGITLSGGEPLLQPEFAAELFEAAHKAGVTTCIDTAAGPFRRDDEPVLRALAASDTVLLDIKAFGPELHRRLTGADNSAVLDCARYLAETGKPVWIRHVLVPGLTDDPHDLENMRKFIDTLPNIKRVDVLPYHELGIAKWKELGIPYRLEGVPPPTQDEVERAKRILCAK
ncbi:MAG: pyruvate formate lyase-activating protein [Kiritimatiellae bacterium]|nr:pyruvate formate lyase-activating protein [Kiritimatiellia bacterium]